MTHHARSLVMTMPAFDPAPARAASPLTPPACPHAPTPGTCAVPAAGPLPVPPPTIPRLALARLQVHRAVLDGAWWPRSWDTAAEFPGLVQGLTIHFGRLRAIVACRDAWFGRPRSFEHDGADVSVYWFSSLDASSIAVTTLRGDQFELLVVPPDASAESAAYAMAAAADPADVRLGREILAHSRYVDWNDQGPP